MVMDSEYETKEFYNYKKNVWTFFPEPIHDWTTRTITAFEPAKTRSTKSLKSNQFLL